MIYLLTGHRGVGKSSLLKRIQNYNPSVKCWDLDREIELFYKKQINQIFQEEGETHFRQMEKRVFQKILNQIKNSEKNENSTKNENPRENTDTHTEAHKNRVKNHHYIAVGAGFEGSIPSSIYVIWLRRSTDSQGRTFINRPPLTKEGSDFEEYLKRFQTREKKYALSAHCELNLMEGLDRLNPWEEAIFQPDSPEHPTSSHINKFDSNKTFTDNLNKPIKNKPHTDDSNKDKKVFSTPVTQLTLLPKNCGSFEQLENFLHIYQKISTHFEIRDDLLSKNQIQWAFQLIPREKIIYSHREYRAPRAIDDNPIPKSDPNRKASHTHSSSLTDWALELGTPPPDCHIISLHQRNSVDQSDSNNKPSQKETKTDLVENSQPFESVKSCALKLEKYKNKHLKLAIPILNFEELWEGHQWWAKDPANRSFLPTSPDGRWSWYRLRQKPYMKINFVKLGGEGSSPDQPSLLEWLKCISQFENFAGVLGEPVEHSHTPIEQDAYFREKNMPVFKIKMSEDELNHLNILKNLGLVCAAVTSPLKIKTATLCDKLTPIAREAESVNTLFLDHQISGHNTDIEGLKSLFKEVSPPLAVWGGGGTRKPMSLILPKNTPFYSARSGRLLEGDAPEGALYPYNYADRQGVSSYIKTLIWAVGRKRHQNWPSLRPQKIIDLNYTDDSPGLEFAIQTQAEYVSGQLMFQVQAEKQRAFWDQQMG